MRALILTALLATLGGCTAPPTLSVPPHAVIGVEERHLSAEHWVERAPRAERLVLSSTAIANQNAQLRRRDPSFNDLEKLPERLARTEIEERIAKLSVRPTNELFDERGQKVSAARLDEIDANVALNAVSEAQPIRYGMVVQRANLRTFPSALRVFSSADDTDIDRFQESALFPGAPVAIVHTSADGRWYFVVSQLYSAWIEKRFVAEGAAQAIFEYATKSPYLVVTGASVRTVFTHERPELSELQLEMGARIPLMMSWPADQLVNGQHPYASYVVELPWRDRNGALQFGPALLPRTADVAEDYLPLNRANIVKQSFKFLGERYGWGHSYNARDCSGFVSEVYRSFGAQLPRNTRDQAMSPVFERITFDADDSNDERLRIVRDLQIGDLVYIPGHVMMVIGHENGVPYVIHDTTGISYRDTDGEVRRVTLNGVSVTPLTPLLGGDRPIVERIYSIVLMRKR